MGRLSQVTGAVTRQDVHSLEPSLTPAPDWLIGSRWATEKAGALVIGGDYRALGTVRSLGRHQIPAWVLIDDHSIAGVSKYAHRKFSWPLSDEEKQVKFLVELKDRHDLAGWVLFASSDETAALVARHHTELSAHFRLTIPPWETLKWAYDKRLTYRLASALGVAHPWTYTPGCREEVARILCTFPAILKPAVKPELNPFTKAKAWRVNDRKALLESYDKACTLLDADAIMIQELIPGDGEEQFSYAALCVEGSPVATLVARRSRQYPSDFGRSSTFVETVEQPQVEQIGHRIVREMRFTGLVEVELKRDPRTGTYKLLDINPRIWGWHTLGQRAGVDFSYLLWRMTQGESISPVRGRAGVRWLRMSTDILAGISEFRRGRLSVRNYLKSICGSVESAIFAPDDLLPGLLEIPLGAYLVLKRRWV